MNSSTLRRALIAYLILLVPVCWLAARFDPFGIDGDSVSYMDIADLLRTHQWSGVINGYWHPLYPAILALGQIIFHPTRIGERSVYVLMNYGVFLLDIVAMLLFVGALVRLRTRMQGAGGRPLLSLDAMRLLGMGLIMASAERELTIGRIRADTLLQTMLLGAFAMMLQALATESLLFAPAMGLFLGLAYLTKSFAFLIGMLSILVMMAFQRWIQRRPLPRILLGGALAAVVFAAVAGPYMAALSLQKHRFDFGDSGSLNYAWFAAGTQKLHLEPWQTERFGTSSVHLMHPVPQLLKYPAIYSYKALPYGTAPYWFDPTYFNERIVPHLNPKVLFKRDLRNVSLVIRYLLNHPEGWVLLIVLLLCGVRPRFRRWRQEGFWVPTVFLGVAAWGIYGMVNIEERYVTFGYLILLLPLFAAFQSGSESEERPSWMPRLGAAMVALLAFVTLSQTLLIALENHRMNVQFDHTAREVYGAAEGLKALGVKPGDEVACMETIACVNNPYWARLAGVRVVTEVSNSGTDHLMRELDALPNRQQVYDIVKSQGAKVIVASFEPGTMGDSTPARKGWVRLGTTSLYALPLDLQALKSEAPSASAQAPWTDEDGPP